MIQAGIKEIKNHLSRYLAQVKAGEEVMITERGNPVARIIKETSKKPSIHNTLAPLVKKGLVVLPTSSLKKTKQKRPEIAGKFVSDMVIEDRR